MLTLEPERLKNRPTTTRKRIGRRWKGFFTRDAQAACAFSLSTSKLSLQKLHRRSFDDLESEIGGFVFAIVNLEFAVLSVVQLSSSVDECHALEQHAIDQSS